MILIFGDFVILPFASLLHFTSYISASYSLALPIFAFAVSYSETIWMLCLGVIKSGGPVGNDLMD